MAEGQRGRAAQEQLFAAGEQMIAEHGPTVSLRDVAAAAGQRNNSAVAYHFGSREAFIEALIRRRSVAMEAQRMAELDLLEDPTVEELVACLVRPMVELLAREPGHYARFLERVRTHPALRDAASLDSWPASRKIVQRIGRLLDLPPARRRARLNALTTTMFALLADVEADGGVLGVEDLARLLTGLVTA